MSMFNRLLILVQSFKEMGGEKHLKDVEPMYRGMVVDRVSNPITKDEKRGQGYIVNNKQGLVGEYIYQLGEMLHDTYPDEIMNPQTGKSEKVKKINRLGNWVINYYTTTGSYKGFRTVESGKMVSTMKMASRPIDAESGQMDEDDISYETPDDEEEENK